MKGLTEPVRDRREIYDKRKLGSLYGELVGVVVLSRI